MTTLKDCQDKFHDPLLKLRYLRLVEALQAAGVGVKFDEDNQPTVYMPAARHMGWIAMDELEPPVDEMVILRTKLGNIVQGFRCKDGNYEDVEGCVRYLNSFSHWMTKP